ncbi:MAG: M48 family metalloprotease [Gammaproteobacteria bacterium]|nr:M48 family metalloprotease [Gammaproteobacteria bacterium]
MLIGLAALIAGCATNPVTGASQFVMVSEEEEIAMGREAAPDVLKRYRRYDNPALQAYVQSVGEQLAQRSHRPNLVYRFTVLDSTEVNAFALPGGYIYITRGLLAYLNSEAQLAAVLGHEIGHVTARHSVRQISAAKAAGIGYTIGAILLPQLRTRVAQDLFNVAGTALLRGYGRDMELEADRLGAQYLAHSSYSPQAMIEVIGVLKHQEEFEQQLAKEEGREPRVYHGLFATHPEHDTRLQEVVGEAEAVKTAETTRVNQEEFFRSLDGLVFGDSEQEGIRRGNRFYHKELGFALSFPEGWRVENLPDRLIAKPREGDALIQMDVADLNQRISPREFMVNRMKLGNLAEGEEIRPGGLEGYTAFTRINTPFGKRRTRVSVIYFRNQAFIIAGAAKEDMAPSRYDGDFLATAQSFHALTEQERPLASALKLRIITASAETGFAKLAGKSNIHSHAEEQLRLLNGMYPTGEPTPGQKLKIVE